MNSNTVVHHRPSLVPLVTAIALAALSLVASGCSDTDHEEGVQLTPLTDEARAALNKNTPTLVQFRFHGEITPGATLCLQLDGYAAVPVPPAGTKFQVKVSLPLPGDFGFYFFESSASDCTVAGSEVWVGPREAIFAAYYVASPLNSCGPRDGGGFEVQATIEDYNVITYTGGQECPTAQETEVVLLARDFELEPAADETVCLEVDGDATYAVDGIDGRYSQTISDVPYNSTTYYRWFVSSESDCSTVVYDVYPDQARITASGLYDTFCSEPPGHAGESWRAFTTDGSGVSSPASTEACPDAFAEEVKFEQNHAVGDTDVGDELGTAVAIDGARMLVGADRSDRYNRYGGAAYVYRRDRDGGWTEEAALNPASAAAWDRFGCAVSLSDTVAAVGLWQRSPDGAVSVFERTGTSWSETALLTPPTGAGRDSFGSAVATDGETVIVGAPFADRNGDADTGAAYIYQDVGGWTLSATLSRSDTPGPGDWFGDAVAVDGDVALVAAPRVDGGVVFVYRNVGGTWTEEAQLSAPEGAPAGLFGTSVDLHGTRAVVGDSAGAGAAFVFDYDGSSWAYTATLTSDAVEPGDRFGESVAVYGDAVAVGAFRSSPGGVDRAGSLHMFEFDGTSWGSETTMVQSDNDAGDRFGIAVDLGASSLVSSASRDDGAGANSGAVYIFD